MPVGVRFGGHFLFLKDCFQRNLSEKGVMLGFVGLV